MLSEGSLKDLSPKLIQLLKGFSIGLVQPKAQEVFLFIFPGFTVGPLSMYYPSPLPPRNVFVTEEFAQIFCGALVPD